MKSLAKFLVGITVVVLILVVYYIISSRLSTVVDAEIVPASRQQSQFDTIAADIARGRYEGVSPLGDVNNYAFVTLNIEADNFSPFTAEWTQYKLKQENGDVLLLISDTGPKDIAPFKSGAFSITVLTSSDNQYREGWLEYYIFGRFHSLKIAPERN